MKVICSECHRILHNTFSRIDDKTIELSCILENQEFMKSDIDQIRIFYNDYKNQIFTLDKTLNDAYNQYLQIEKNILKEKEIVGNKFKNNIKKRYEKWKMK